MTSATRRPAPSPQTDAYTRMRTTHPRLFDNPVHGIVILDDDQADDAAAAAAARGQTAQALRQVGVVYSDPFLTLLRDPVRFPDGQLGLYLRVVHPGPPGVAILPITDDGHVFLVEHYRHATRSWHWEIPRGFGEGDAFVDVATSTINTAMRELGEEIGATARELLPLGDTPPGHRDPGQLRPPVRRGRRVHRRPRGARSDPTRRQDPLPGSRRPRPDPGHHLRLHGRRPVPRAPARTDRALMRQRRS